MFGRKKIAMLVAEFLGTGILTLVILSVQRSTIGIAYFIAIGAGLAFAGLSVIFSGVSGGHFNPAITIGLWTTRKVRTLAAVSYVVAQLLGGWAAYGIYGYFVNNSLQKIGGHFTARIMIAEATGVFIFGLVWAAVSAQRLAVAYSGVGLAIGTIVASTASSLALLNPAVALGTRAWGFWGGMGWGTYVLGPVVGGIIAFNLYELVFSDGRWSKLAPARVTSGANVVTATSTSAVVEPVEKPVVVKKKVVAKKPARKTGKK